MSRESIFLVREMLIVRCVSRNRGHTRHKRNRCTEMVADLPLVDVACQTVWYKVMLEDVDVVLWRHLAACAKVS